MILLQLLQLTLIVEAPVMYPHGQLVHALLYCGPFFFHSSVQFIIQQQSQQTQVLSTTDTTFRVNQRQPSSHSQILSHSNNNANWHLSMHIITQLFLHVGLSNMNIANQNEKVGCAAQTKWNVEIEFSLITAWYY